MIRRTAGRAALPLLLLLAPGPLPASDDATVQLSSDLRVAVRRGRDVVLALRADAGDDWGSVARRLAGRRREARAIEAWNRGTTIEEDTWIEIPLALAKDDLRALVLRTLFPEDDHDGEAWVHRARAGVIPTYDEGLWQIAEWFTGRGRNFRALMRANGLSSPELRHGQPIRIPPSMLHPAFARREQSEDGLLEFGRDDEGPHASYRLRPGEALYTAVVMRFTGRMDSADVVELAERIAGRSGIPDAHDIPAGFAVKIPLDVLEPQYLPRGHPRRVEAERRREEVERELAAKPVEATREGLDGVVVILDPGHGGRDMGTVQNGIWEHDYVYDVACRLREMLEGETRARVVMTLIDAETGCAPSTADRLVANHQGTIQTRPPFLARAEGEARIGVNLRWYLANSIYRRETSNGGDGDRVVFLSLHADSRHASLRGAMVYVPGASHRARTYGHARSPYLSYEEVRERPHVSFGKKERVRSEALSRKLADAVVRGFSREDLPVQPFQPVRDKIIRGKSQFVPAVLRGNAVPGKVLVEMVNLSNAEDARLLGRASMRDRLARGLYHALFDYFGEEPSHLTASRRGRPASP